MHRQLRSVARQLIPLATRRELTPIKQAYNLHRLDSQLSYQPTIKPVCQQSLSQGLLLRRTRRFFPSGGRNHSQYSFLPTHGGMAQAE